MLCAVKFKIMSQDTKVEMEKILESFKPMLKNEEELYMIKNALELFYGYGVHNC